MARQGIEPRSSDLRVRCPTDCATRPSSSTLTSLLFISGLSVLSVPQAVNYLTDAVLNCSVTGGVQANRAWTGPPSGFDIVVNGLEVSTTDKYSETVNTDWFSLTVRESDFSDSGFYTCSNGFDASSAVKLEVERKYKNN